jgi:hypothetical protein
MAHSKDILPVVAGLEKKSGMQEQKHFAAA